MFATGDAYQALQNGFYTPIKFPVQPFITGNEVAQLSSDGLSFRIVDRGMYVINYQFQIGPNSYTQEPGVRLTLNGSEQQMQCTPSPTQISYNNPPAALSLNPGDTLRLEGIASADDQLITNYAIMIRRVGPC
ncbi:MAG: hypothetical protein LBK46_03040 [Oscillospiraceae bacterium]|nr:hypothetical protein [Oscillospiraceae bacterium]